MSATTFLLVRHGSCERIGERLNGRGSAVHLTEQGRAEAEELGERLARLPIRALYASPLERTRETAVPLARRLGLPVTVREEFLEIDFGEWTGRSIAELSLAPEWQQYNTFRGGTPIPGGELAATALARALAGLVDLAARHEGELVAIFTHGDIVRYLLLHFLGGPVDHVHRLEIRPASVSALELAPWGPRVLAVNHSGSLPVNPV